MNTNQNPPFPISSMLVWGIVCAVVSGGTPYLLLLIIPQGINEILYSFGIDLNQMIVQTAIFAAGSGLIFGIALRAMIHSLKNYRS